VRKRVANKNNANTQENRFAEEWPDEEWKGGSRKIMKRDYEREIKSVSSSPPLREGKNSMLWDQL
jgi:hypothetical protein